MSLTFKRTDRIAEMIQRKLSQIIYQEIKDPRLPSLITISSVTVTRDLSHAKVYFTVFNGEHAQAELILNAAASYLRTALARTLTFRIVPELHFTYDNSIEYAANLTRLINQANPDDDTTD